MMHCPFNDWLSIYIYVQSVSIITNFQQMYLIIIVRNISNNNNYTTNKHFNTAILNSHMNLYKTQWMKHKSDVNFNVTINMHSIAVLYSYYILHTYTYIHTFLPIIVSSLPNISVRFSARFFKLEPICTPLQHKLFKQF